MPLIKNLFNLVSERFFLEQGQKKKKNSYILCQNVTMWRLHELLSCWCSPPLKPLEPVLFMLPSALCCSRCHWAWPTKSCLSWSIAFVVKNPKVFQSPPKTKPSWSQAYHNITAVPDTNFCLNYCCSMARRVTMKEAFNWRLAHSLRGPVRDHHGGNHTGMALGQ